MAALAQETVNKLLDFNQKLDIGLLDTVVGTLYAGSGGQQKMAQEVLTTLKEHPDAWTKVSKLNNNNDIFDRISSKETSWKNKNKTEENSIVHTLCSKQLGYAVHESCMSC